MTKFKICVKIKFDKQGIWCNGSTTDFDSVSSSSNLLVPANMDSGGIGRRKCNRTCWLLDDVYENEKPNIQGANPCLSTKITIQGVDTIC